MSEATEPVAWDLYNEVGRFDLTDSLAMAREWEKTPGNVAHPLYRHPAPRGRVVTDAMVEAVAIPVYTMFGGSGYEWQQCGDFVRFKFRDFARRLLTAALVDADAPEVPEVGFGNPTPAPAPVPPVVTEDVSNAYELPDTVQSIVDAVEQYEKKHGHWQDYRMSRRDEAFPVDKTERAIVVAYRKHKAALTAALRPETRVES